MSDSATLQIVRILEGTSVDGPGLRTSIYLAGCLHRCPGCHNPATWDFAAGKPYTVSEVMKVIIDNGSGVTFSGGDPLYQAEALLPLAKAIKAEGLSLWCYTGFRYEEISDPAAKELLHYIDVLVDGPFIEAQKDTSLIFRGSRNQRLIDVRATLSARQIIEYTPAALL